MRARASVVVLVLALVASRAGAAPPLLDLGDRGTAGAAVRAVATCDGDRAVTLEDGGWLDTWKLASGERTGALGPPRRGILQAIACSGELVLDARGDEVVLWRGATAVARAKTSGVLGAAIVDGHGYFADEHGVYQLPADGWAPWPAEGIGLSAIVRPDLVVSAEGSRLDWRTRAGARQVVSPDAVAALADLGDAIAVADKRGEVFLLTGPTLGKPAVTVAGEPSALAGDRAWLAIGLRDGTLVQARRAAAMAALPPLRVERDDMYEAIRAIAIAGDRWLVAGDDQRLHRVPRGAASYQAPALAGHASTPWTVAVDDRWIVSGSSDETVRVVALDGKLVQVLHPTSETGTRPILEVGLSPRFVWARDDYHYLYRWRRPDLRALPVIAGIESAAALDGGKLAVIAKGRLGTLDLETGALRSVGGKLDLLEGKLATGGGVAVAIDHVDQKPSVVLDAHSGAVLAQIALTDGASRSAPAVCPGGAMILYADDREVHVWSVAKRAVVASATMAEPVSALACSATGRVAIGTWDGVIAIRSVDGLRALTELPRHHGWVQALAWSGQRLASAGGDLHVQLADVP